MTKHDYKQNAYYMLYLIKCVLHNKIPAKEKLDKMDLSQLYEVASEHSLTAMTAYALESAGIYDEAFKQAKSKAIRKNKVFVTFFVHGTIHSFFLQILRVLLRCCIIGTTFQ